MSTFRNAITALLGKDGYFLIGTTAVKATVDKINDDLVVLKLADTSAGYSEIVVNIDNLIVVTGPA